MSFHGVDVQDHLLEPEWPKYKCIYYDHIWKIITISCHNCITDLLRNIIYLFWTVFVFVILLLFLIKDITLT